MSHVFTTRAKLTVISEQLAVIFANKIFKHMYVLQPGKEAP